MVVVVVVVGAAAAAVIAVAAAAVVTAAGDRSTKQGRDIPGGLAAPGCFFFRAGAAQPSFARRNDLSLMSVFTSRVKLGTW